MRELKLNMSRTTLESLLPRLKHNKHANTEQTRVRNSIIRSTEKAQELYKQGKLRPVMPVRAITTEKDLIDYMEKIKSKGEYVLDFESSGLNIWKDIIVGIALYVEGEQPAYVPLNHTKINGIRLPGQIEESKAKEIVKPYFEDKKIKVILHNAKFDDKLLYGNWEIRLGNIYWDTMVAQHILNENESKGLKDLYHRYINRNDSGYDYGDLFGNNTPFNFIPLNLATIYGANDGIKTWQLYKFQKKWLNPHHKSQEFRDLYKVFIDIEMRLMKYVIDMELRGVQIDKEYFKELEKRLTISVTKAKETMDKILLTIKDKILEVEELNRLTKGTGKINYNSPKQVQIVLYDILRLPVVDRRNPRGTGEPVLKKLYEQVKVKSVRNFIEAFLEYKAMRKLLTSFVKKLPLEVEERTNAIHSQFNQVGTVTGRFASRNPNLQQIPSRGEWGSKIRQGFVARDGYVFLGSDYS